LFHVDATLVEPRTDGFLTAEGVRVDEDLGHDKSATATDTRDHDARPAIVLVLLPIGLTELPIFVPNAYCHVVFP
jgi:hypothetical protein